MRPNRQHHIQLVVPALDLQRDVTTRFDASKFCVQFIERRDWLLIHGSHLVANHQAGNGGWAVGIDKTDRRRVAHGKQPGERTLIRWDLRGENRRQFEFLVTTFDDKMGLVVRVQRPDRMT